MEDSELLQVEVVDNEVVSLPGSGDEDMIELCVHLAASQGERVWGDGRLELPPKVAGAAVLKAFARLDKLAARNVPRLVDGEVGVYLGSKFEWNALEGRRCRLGGLHDAVFWLLLSEMEMGVTKSSSEVGSALGFVCVRWCHRQQGNGGKGQYKLMDC